MDTILIAVTVLSLALATTMSVVAARMMREERRRSEARVALLSRLAADPPRADGARIVAPSQPLTGIGDLFHVEAEPSAWPRRLAVIGGLAAVLAVVVLGFPWTAPSGATPEKTARAAQPLDLLSLRHAQQDGMLTITGLVQNPRGGAPLRSVEATVLVFDPSGEMLTSGRAPLDFTTLASGDESPFVIRVAVAGPVARYRVGFRGADGRVLGHVDRRQSESLAQKQVP